MIRPTVLAFSYNCFSLFYKTSPPYNTFSSSTSKASLYQIGNKSLRVHIPVHSRFLCESAQSTSMDSKDLYLYNTMTKQKEVFKPKDPGKVSMYVCGISAYDFGHIGHARVYVTFDILYRYLQYLGYEVKYIRNFTDIDDKIILRANKLGENPISLSSRFCEEFRIDIAKLNCLPPPEEPRVTEHISEIKKMIQECRKEKARIESTQILEEVVRSIPDALGLLSSNCSEVIMELKRKALIRAGLSEEELMQMIEEREYARSAKRYAESDNIRKKLAVKGISVMDGADGTTWRPSIPLEEESHGTKTS